MKRQVVAVFLLFLTMAAMAADETVYVTKTGTKYHRAGCRHLAKSAIPMALSEAASRYSPCSACNPPIPQRKQEAATPEKSPVQVFAAQPALAPAADNVQVLENEKARLESEILARRNRIAEIENQITQLRVQMATARGEARTRTVRFTYMNQAPDGSSPPVGKFEAGTAVIVRGYVKGTIFFRAEINGMTGYVLEGDLQPTPELQALKRAGSAAVAPFASTPTTVTPAPARNSWGQNFRTRPGVRAASFLNF